MNIVEKMIDFRSSQNQEVFGDLPTVDFDNLNVIVIEILSWLKLERKRELWIQAGKKTSLKPMELNMRFPWCSDLVKIMQVKNSFTEIFCINGKYMCFKEEISDENASDLRRLADEMYDPQMILG